MAEFLRRPRTIIGFMIETGQPATRACCTELVAPGGAFELLHTRHALCPRVWPTDVVLRFEDLCSLTTHTYKTARGELRDAWPWEMLWLPCGSNDTASTSPPAVGVTTGPSMKLSNSSRLGRTKNWLFTTLGLALGLAGPWGASEIDRGDYT
jgi:hypothetical protein